MKQFSLGLYLANPERKVVTRDGRPARVVCTDTLGGNPVVALVKCKDANSGKYYEAPLKSTHDGKISSRGECCCDLFFEPIKQSRWVFLCTNAYGEVYTSKPYRTKEEAEKPMEIKGGFGLTKITWEE